MIFGQYWFMFLVLIITVAIVVILAIVLYKGRKSSRSNRSSRSTSQNESSASGSTPEWCQDVLCLDFDVDENVTIDIELQPVKYEDDDVSTHQASLASLGAVSGLRNLCTTVPEAEEHIASNPVSDSQFMGAVSDFSLRGGFNTTKYSYTLDGGNTWSQHFVPVNGGNFPVTSDARTWGANSDPVVAFGPASNKVYLASLYFNVSNNANGLYICSSTLPNSSGSAAFTSSQVLPVKVNTSVSTTDFEDKPWITTNPVTGDLYVVWTHFSSTTDYILFSKSVNGGHVWSTPIQVSPNAFNGAVQGAQVAADAHNNVWVTWTTFYVNGIRRIHGSKSTNGGTTFSSIGFPVSPYFYGLSFPSNYRKEAFSAMAVENVSGTVHVAFPATAQTGVSKILYVRGPNGSTTFTNPINLINTISGNQFFPAIAVDKKTASVQVSWFDTRNCTVSGNRQIDIYTTRNNNAGLSFLGNTRVTPTKTDVGAITFVGDYCGVAIQAGKALPVFAFLVTPLQTALVT